MASSAPPLSTAAPRQGRFARALPGLTLILLAPLVAELLPGATRMSSAFVFPIEMVIWGGGAAVARDLVRRLGLSWVNLLLLALALSLAEECLIQQTSFAPLVVKLKGVEYARAAGVNYVYLAWALLYESLFVVLIPVALAELVFPARKAEPWLNRWAYGVLAVLAVPACCAAWYGWNIVARAQAFHLPPYYLPLQLGLAGAATIAVLLVVALGPWRRALAPQTRPSAPPHPAIVFALSALAACLIFAVEIFAFGEWPAFPPAGALALALATGLAMLLVVPRWTASPVWRTGHEIALLYGATIANCLVLFASFIGASAIDLYGKIAIDLLALVWLVWLARKRLAA